MPRPPTPLLPPSVGGEDPSPSSLPSVVGCETGASLLFARTLPHSHCFSKARIWPSAVEGRAWVPWK